MKSNLLKASLCVACLMMATPLAAQSTSPPGSADIAAGEIVARQALENARRNQQLEDQNSLEFRQRQMDERNRELERYPEILSEAARERRDQASLLRALEGKVRDQGNTGLATVPALTNPNQVFQVPQDPRNFFGPTPSEAKMLLANQRNNQANQAIFDLVQKLKGADGEEAKKEIKTEIGQLLSDQYDSYLEQHEKPLKQLEERLKTLREEFEKRKQAKDDLVKLRLDTIWYNSLGLNWPANSAPTPSWATNRLNRNVDWAGPSRDNFRPSNQRPTVLAAPTERVYRDLNRAPGIDSPSDGELPPGDGR